MKHLLFIIMIMCACATNGFSQSISSGYFVVPNEALDSKVQDQLGNKIKAALSKADVFATDAYFPMVTIVKYDEIETIEIDGMRKMYKTIGSVTVLVTFTNTNTALATEEFEVNGVGATKKASQAKAIESINIPTPTIKKMMVKAKVGYEKSLLAFTAGKLSEAKKHKAKKNYIDALEVLSDIPSDSKDFAEANKLNAEIEKLIEKDSKEEQRRQDIQAQREFELQQQRLKNEKDLAVERQKTEQVSIEARGRVTEQYYRAWQAYYSGR